MGAYLRPRELNEALQALTNPSTVLAGGTDLYPTHVGRPFGQDVVDISGIETLRGVTATDTGWRIGATTTWTEIAEAALPPLFDGLRRAAREVGGRQIQNAGTVAGNLCNASPAADGVPALLALDAEVEVASHDARRRLPLDAFIIGPRRTALQAGELVLGVDIPRPARPARSGFLKLGARRYLVISIAMAAAVLETDGDVVTAARVAVGACSPVARRLQALEATLAGGRLDRHLADRVDVSQLGPLAPIDDVRGSASYRKESVLVLLRRLLTELAA